MGFKSMFVRKKKSSTSSKSPSAVDGAEAAEIFTRSPSSNAEAQIEELRQVFRRFDVNSDGKISSSELGAMITSLGQTATEEEIQRMIIEADKDGDGFISLEEFIEINIKDVDSDEALESLRGAFSVFDIDGNGSISAEELHKVLKGLGDACSVAECKRMISGVDADGDGMISFEEFKVMMDNGLRFGRLEVDPPSQSG
uniref:EF-hand domain-containing protein n=1 Tax=Kalanchoe fedtschenkoi TaxID=63787 RepID=A0A7N0TGH9_KALFE